MLKSNFSGKILYIELNELHIEYKPNILMELKDNF